MENVCVVTQIRLGEGGAGGGGDTIGGGGGRVWLKPGLFGSWMCVCWQDSTRQLPNRPHMVFQCVWTPGIK